MSPNTRILVVEDDAVIQAKIESQLGNEFDTELASNMRETTVKTQEWNPDIILLDVALKERNGYEVCDALKQDHATRDTPVILYSNNDSLRERMLGYEVGAVDYFHIKSNADEIRARINAQARQAQTTQQLKASVATAQKTAMEALSTSSELGKAVRYVEQSYDATEFDELAHLLAEFCGDLDLSAIIMFTGRQGQYFYASGKQEVSPIERELINKLHASDRFVDFGCRTLTNYPQVSLLVKNMPIDDRERYGRLKDALPFVLGSTDAKVRMIDAEKALTAHCASLTSSVEAAQLTLDMVHDDFQNQLDVVQTIMGELGSTMEMDIEKMNMDQTDEEHILQLIESTSNKLHLILKENIQTEDILEKLVSLLNKLTTEQSKIILDTLVTNTQEDNMDYQSDIELF